MKNSEEWSIVKSELNIETTLKNVLDVYEIFVISGSLIDAKIIEKDWTISNEKDDINGVKEHYSKKSRKSF